MLCLENVKGKTLGQSTVNSSSRGTSNDSSYAGLLKNRISELEKQHADKNSMIRVFICSKYL